MSHCIQEIEWKTYATLEKLASDTARAACLGSPHVVEATVRVQRPHAIAFADSFSVQLTRPRSAFTGELVL